MAAALPRLREALRLDLAIVNAENASHGFGLSPDMADALCSDNLRFVTLSAPAGASISVLAQLAPGFARRHSPSLVRAARTYGSDTATPYEAATPSLHCSRSRSPGARGVEGRNYGPALARPRGVHLPAS